MEPVTIFVLLAGVFFAFLYFHRQYNRRRLLSLAGILDEHPTDVRGWFGFRLEGHFRGREASFRIEPGRKNSPPRFFVSLACRAPVAFVVTREQLGSKIAKALRLLKDVEVGDPELDGRFVFKCAEPDSFAPWIREPSVRAAVLSLMTRRQVDLLEAEEGSLKAMRAGRGAAFLDPENARGILEDEEILVRSLEVGT
jgi:hypothetical protein